MQMHPLLYAELNSCLHRSGESGSQVTVHLIGNLNEWMKLHVNPSSSSLTHFNGKTLLNYMEISNPKPELLDEKSEDPHSH